MRSASGASRYDRGFGSGDNITASNPCGAWTLGEAALGTGAGFTALPNYTTSDGQATGGPSAWYGSDPTGGAVPNYGLPLMHFVAGHLVVLPHYDVEDGTTLTDGDLLRGRRRLGNTTSPPHGRTSAAGPTQYPGTEGVQVTLSQNGVSLFGAFVGLEDGIPSANTSNQVTLAAGGTLDFVVNSRGSQWNDDTQLDATIQSVPEPSALVLLAFGLIGLLAYAWRKRK